jgi:hypothetical protein
MALNSSRNKSAMDEPRLVCRSNKQQVKRNDSDCSVLASAVHCVTNYVTMTGLLIAICKLPASRIALMNNLTPHQMPLCRF